MEGHLLVTAAQQSPTPMVSDGPLLRATDIFYLLVPWGVGGLVAGVLWYQNTDAWSLTPRHAIGLPAIALAAEVGIVLVLQNVSKMDPRWMWLFGGLAVIIGVSFIIGAALRQQHWHYAVAGTGVTVGVAADSIAFSPLPFSVIFVLVVLVITMPWIGLSLGYLFGTTPTVTT